MIRAQNKKPPDGPVRTCASIILVARAQLKKSKHTDAEVTERGAFGFSDEKKKTIYLF